MSRTPSDDVTGGGPSAYSGNPDLRTPALGRSSRDLASDTGPAGASNEQFGVGDRSGEMLTGGSSDPIPDPDAPIPRGRKFNPDIDPDTRLGLHPTIKGDAAPDHDVDRSV